MKLKEIAPNYLYINEEDYASYYQSVIADDDLLSYSNQISDLFDDSVIFNDYEDFIDRTYHIIMGKLKNKR